jgi:hypothetical protein
MQFVYNLLILTNIKEKMDGNAAKNKWFAAKNK